MTIINQDIDNRISKPGRNGPYLWGMTRSRHTSGGDRTPADKLAGVYPDHPYSGSIAEIFYGDYATKVVEFGSVVFNGRAGFNGSGISYTQPRAWDANDEIQLLGKLGDKYRNGAQWNAGIFVAELGKTTDLVASRIKAFGRAALQVKRGNPSKALSILREKPGPGRRPYKVEDWYQAWLEMRYAWRPMLKDIYDLSDSIRQLDVPRQKSLRVSSRINRTIIPSGGGIKTVTGKGAYVKYIQATLSEKPFSFPAYLGLDDPLSIAWEVIPLSFVADWFVPIGNYLSTRNIVSEMEGKFVRTTHDWYRGRVTEMVAFVGDAQFNTQRSDPSGYIAQVNITRTIHTSLSVPLPTFRNPLGASPATRLLDALALVQSVFSPKR